MNDRNLPLLKHFRFSLRAVWFLLSIFCVFLAFQTEFARHKAVVLPAVVLIVLIWIRKKPLDRIVIGAAGICGAVAASYVDLVLLFGISRPRRFIEIWPIPWWHKVIFWYGVKNALGVVVFAFAASVSIRVFRALPKRGRYLGS